MKLCSEIAADVSYPVCDLPVGHEGPHRATIFWGDEVYEDDGNEDH